MVVGSAGVEQSSLVNKAIYQTAARLLSGARHSISERPSSLTSTAND